MQWLQFGNIGVVGWGYKGVLDEDVRNAGWGHEGYRMRTQGFRVECEGFRVECEGCKDWGFGGFRMGLMLCAKASFVLGRLLRFGNGAPRSEHRKIETSALSAADFQFQQLLHLERTKMHSGLVGVN